MGIHSIETFVSSAFVSTQVCLNQIQWMKISHAKAPYVSPRMPLFLLFLHGRHFKANVLKKNPHPVRRVTAYNVVPL